MSDEFSQERLKELYVKHEKRLYNVVYRWVWDEHEAQDVVQDGFVKLWRIKERVDLENAEAFLYKITLNLAAKRRRWQKIRQAFAIDSLTSGLAREIDTRDGLQLLEASRNEASLKAAIEKLPLKMRQTLMLCEFSDFSYEEIAEILSIPAGTVGSRRNNAIKALKQHWEKTDAKR